METDFNEMSPMHGLQFNRFSRLSDQDIADLVRLIARCCEKSFRRGFQQGWDSRSRGDELAVDICSWRFDSDLDQSFSPHGSYTSTAVERLEIECHLGMVGLRNSRCAD